MNKIYYIIFILLLISLPDQLYAHGGLDVIPAYCFILLFTIVILPIIIYSIGQYVSKEGNGKPWAILIGTILGHLMSIVFIILDLEYDILFLKTLPIKMDYFVIALIVLISSIGGLFGLILSRRRG